ncbi:MAG: cytochrome o ubiquinol oxidase subunit III [Puniceicoccaceae bacterium 5H]|nr:MAG: cytochrome o ubiquinol oxidase subunit III [Puniceicoccaceae bacterium 5H]
MSHSTTADPLEELKQTNTGIENKKLAMWAFLASDCMFFGTLISTHLIYRRVYADVVDPTQIFDIELTGISSFVLLASSFSMALAVSSAHKGNMLLTRLALSATIFGGLVFLGGQVYEFSHFVHEKGLTLDGNIFGSSFYLLTGTHGTHVAIGVLWLISHLVHTFTPGHGRQNALDIESTGLYWHFVDIVWIVIFTAVYLVEYLHF